MSKVKLAQCLCPQRHTIIALADENREKEEFLNELRELIGKMLREKQLNPWCGLCGAKSDSWLYEVGDTEFDSLEEAIPAMAKLQSEQLRTAQILNSLGLTYNSQDKRRRANLN